VAESKKSLKMEATMERQASEFDLEREQLKNRLQREENRARDLVAQVEQLTWQLEAAGIKPGKKEGVHTVEIKQNVSLPQSRMSVERTGAWNAPAQSGLLTKPAGNIVEREAGLSPRTGADLSVRKRDNIRYASPQNVGVDRGHYSDSEARGVDRGHYSDSEARVGPIGAVADSKHILDAGHKLNVSIGGPTIVSSGGRISVQTTSPSVSQGPVSPRRMINISRGTPPPIPPNKPNLPVTMSTVSKLVSSTQKPVSVSSPASKDVRPGVGKVHIPVSVVHTTTVTSSQGSRAPSQEGSPASLRKPAQVCVNAK